MGLVRTGFGLCIGLLLLTGPVASRAQITTHTALPITEGRGVVRVVTRFVQAFGPIGKTDQRGRLPSPLQPGSGSWDPFAGVTLTRQTFAWQMDLNLAYQHNGQAGGFQFGDELRFDPAFKYRLLPRDLGGGVPSFLYLNLEANLIWEDENQQGGAEMSASSGWTWLIDPGLQYVTRRVVIEGAVQLPAYQNVGPAVLEKDSAFILSTRVNI